MWKLALVFAFGACASDEVDCTEERATWLDPATMVCLSHDETCGDAVGLDVDSSDWPPCQGACGGLDESHCLAAADCHATYAALLASGAVPAFESCVALAPSGPVTGACDGLDASACSRHHDCSSVYDRYPVNFPNLEFNRCE